MTVSSSFPLHVDVTTTSRERVAHSFSNTLYGVLFGVVSGMMVIVAIKELLPTARRYDPKDTVVTNAFVIGMGIMAISLVLFVA